MTENNPITEALAQGEMNYEPNPLQYVLVELNGPTDGTDVGVSLHVVGIDNRMAAHILGSLAQSLTEEADKADKEALEATGVLADKQS